MKLSTRLRCSEWAQQGSNLRPLGEQRPVYPGDTSPTDHGEQGVGVYRGLPGSTRFVDVKWTADHGRRLVRRAADLALLAVLFLPLYVAALVMDRDDRKAGSR